ncbi:tripartite tricarboxylate transporter substrate binding protein [Candidimonas humi]|jgi:tripartite-type tricarboxylate transporter receptor subunit TctC|uniref:Bug family tripartite tricarboxylate transporter substrate binding protein n=1 Tax=Candidimonas humi TaxID=683355 RepID=A0ABV8P101_9BURK|nr:tripartite tricarboxylate transporter substrate binding protein [Candidimonas humi]MBV6306944.1 tripartite tricarboxylate transporter substrate binding protein [Candidimonas humi]
MKPIKKAAAAALALCTIAAASLFPAATAAAAGYPDRPVKIVVGFPPGGGNDVLARLLAERLQAQMGQPFVVENRPGANGFIAFDTVKRAKPDGYTLLIGPSSGMTVNPAVYKKLPYDPVADFSPVSMIGGFPLLIVVNPATPYRSLVDLVGAAKAKPGTIDYGSAATSFQLATEMFAQQAHLRFNHIPYKGSAQAVQAVLANQVPMTFGDSAAVIPQIRAGKLRPLAVTTGKRIASLPQVPTVAEAGGPDYQMLLWSGLFAPSGTPASIVAALQAGVQQALRDPKMQASLDKLGIEPIGSSAAELEATIRSQIAQYTEVAKQANISIQ